METIEFQCAVAKVQTLASDNGVRIWLDLPEGVDALAVMAQLGACQTHGVYLQAVLTPTEENSPADGDYWAQRTND